VGNRKILINTLEALEVFDGRYKNLKCVNYDLTKPEDAKRGCFSLVFKANDTLENRPVAIKFYDPHPRVLSNTYRLKAFEREPEILKTLQSKGRCLQLVSDMKIYFLVIRQGGDEVAQIPCKYFVAEWIEDEIDTFFEDQERVDAIAKLQLFHQIALGVTSLHRQDGHHRDIKADNLRLKKDDRKNELVVAIDLGAAARAEDVNLLAEYADHAGAPAYASPEATVGFSGHREIGHLTDWYALGALLYELFNRDLFYSAHRKHSPNYDAALALTSLGLQKHSKLQDKLEALHKNLGTLRHVSESPPVDGDNSTVPAAIEIELRNLVRRLTEFDYRLRLRSIEELSLRINSCIRALENGLLAKRRKEQKKEWRRRRIEKLKRRELGFQQKSLAEAQV